MPSVVARQLVELMNGFIPASLTNPALKDCHLLEQCSELKV